MSSLFKATSITKSEIILALYCISHGYSDNSTHHFGDSLCALCPTSPEAYDLKMGLTKLMYIISFSLYPYYKNLLSDDLAKTSCIVVMFDENLNKVFQKSQMDFIVYFWGSIAKRFLVRFFDSLFMGYTTHQDLLTNFEDALINLDRWKIIQISVDGTNTNLKFLDELKKTRATDELNDVINMGTCNLYTVQNIFEIGVSSSGWDIKKLLKGAQPALHDTHAMKEE